MVRTDAVLLVAVALAASACGRAGGGADGGVDAPVAADAPDAEPPRTLPAFPGAEGFGRFSLGGRGGEVCHVTTLDDLGPGTLRNCLLVGRSHVTVVFDVAGWITLASPLNITGSRITLAGQTAPGGGIGLRGQTVVIAGADVVMRFLRIRRGTVVDRRAQDTLDIASSASQVMVDHCSVGFGIDETFSIPGDEPTGPRDVTVQWTINGYALQVTNHSAGSLLMANDTSIHHTLWALNKTRNPRARTTPDGILDWVNNVTYGWNARHPFGEAQGFTLSYDAFMMANTPNGSHHANAVGNYFVSARAADFAFNAGMVGDGGVPAFNLYFQDNLLDGNANGVLDVSKSDWSMVAPTATQLPARLPAPQVTTDPAEVAYRRVLDSVGATVPARDEVDALLIQHVRDQSGLLITTEADLVDEGISNGGYGTLAPGTAPPDGDGDGMPDAWESAHGLDPASPADGNADGNGDGYTNLEEFLASLVPLDPA